ncbi:MAG: hypothetical protein RLZ00_385 [Pseudomonadota bacterium]
MIHKPQGSNTQPAPMMRRKPMSSGRRVCAADALATTMKDDQISTVRTAQVSPRALGESFMRGMINPSQFQSCVCLEIEANVYGARTLLEFVAVEASVAAVWFTLCPLSLDEVLAIDIVFNADAIAFTVQVT